MGVSRLFSLKALVHKADKSDCLLLLPTLLPRNAIFELYITDHDWKFQSFNVKFVSHKPQKKSAKGKEKKLKRKEVIIVSIYLHTVTLSMQTNIHRNFIKLILKLKRWILCELCAFVFCAGTDEPLTCTRSRSAAFFNPILPKNLLLISNMAHLTIEVFACFNFACHYNWRSPIVSFFRFLSFFFLCILSYLKPWGTLTYKKKGCPSSHQ